MTTSFNKLTPAQAERLALLAEECGECIQAIGKILRHGYESVDPMASEHAPTNRQSLERELGDVLAAIAMLDERRDISPSATWKRRNEKLDSIGHWLHHQKDVQ
jgi:NTP pyrophosphatase (non-canonical NTP hydrolase)